MNKRIREKNEPLSHRRNEFYILKQPDGTTTGPYSSRGLAESEIEINGIPGKLYLICTKVVKLEVVQTVTP